MQTAMNAARGLMAHLIRLVNSWKQDRTEGWDRVYLCSAAPLGAEFVRDYEEAERHHHQW
jgi:hypothetical protein